jgi:hypothetical protein
MRKYWFKKNKIKTFSDEVLLSEFYQTIFHRNLLIPRNWTLIKKNIFQYSVVKADRQLDKMLKWYVHNTYKWWSKYCKWLTTIVCINFCQNYLTELTIKHNPLLPLSRISDISKFCNGPMNFEITRFTCIFYN